MNRFSNKRVVHSDWEVCIGSESVPSVAFYDQSDEVLCSMIIVEASKVGDILRFVDLLIKCNFSPELIYYWCKPYYSKWQWTKRINNAVTTGIPSSRCEMIVMRNKSHGENISLCGNNNDHSWEVKIPSNSQENISPYFQRALLTVSPLIMLKRSQFSEFFISRFTTPRSSTLSRDTNLAAWVLDALM